MKTEMSFQFATSQIANRFVHELKDWRIAKVKTRLFNGGDSVKVTYDYDQNGFNYTCSELDDLASQHNGKEI
jgi:hypothetical protein